MTLRLCAILSIIAAIALALVFRSRHRGQQFDGPGTRAIHATVVITLVLMSISSILMLAIGLRMHGWMLMLHMTIAPLFSLAIATLALLWARRTSTCLRLVLLSGFVTILSALLTMMTWFGSDWQRFLMTVHRVSSMVLLVAAAAQAGKWLLAGSGDGARARD